MRLLVLAGLFCAFSAPAFAQDPFQDLLDDDDDSFGKDFGKDQQKDAETEPEPEPKPDPEPELDFEDDPEEEGEGDDLLEEDPNAQSSVSGDTAEVYRRTLSTTVGMDVDDEMQVWEQYLQTFPASPFRAQIEARMKVLEDALYKAARPENDKPQVDAKDKQLAFSQALLLESINPRQRITLLLEWGLPDWANLAAGYEHPFGKKFSVIGQFRRRFTGPSLEAGIRWSPVKSQRTRTLVTVLFDVHMNLAPAFIGFRPQLAIGKAFGPLELQAQGGVDVSPRAELDIRGIGGVHVSYRAAEAVALFAETSILIKNKSGAAGPFRFNQIAFGMRFYPLRKAKRPDNTEINLGAAIPYSSAYWRYHFGAVVGQANFYLD